MGKKNRFRFFGANIKPSCGHCQYGQRSADGEHVLCKKKGITAVSYSCSKYVYSPVKRIPQRGPTLFGSQEFSKEDFEL